jgi:hypothetical protein
MLCMRSETVTYYITDEGEKFLSESECRERERVNSRIRKILSPLGERPALSGELYITHDTNLVYEVRNNFLSYAETVNDWGDLVDHFDAARRQRAHNQTFVGRIIDDSNIPELRRAWHRFMSIDMHTGNEYNQPYYALQEYKRRHPEEYV